MEDPKWLRLITIGLVLAAVAIGYLLFTGRFFSDTAQKAKTEISQNIPSPLPSVSPSESVSPKPTQNQTGAQISSPSPAPAAGRVAERSGGALNGDIRSLPRTAFPMGVGIIFSLVAIVAGWDLRKFPK